MMLNDEILKNLESSKVRRTDFVRTNKYQKLWKNYQRSRGFLGFSATTATAACRKIV